MPTTTRYWKRKQIASKIEVTPGVDAGPTVVANAMEARNVQLTPLEAQYVTNDVETAYFGNSPEALVSAGSKLQFEIAVQGSGTAGVAPAFGPLLRACGMAEVNLAAAVAGTAQAGSTATSLKLAAAASAIDNAYKGMRVRITGGTGNGQVAYVLAYNGTSKVATTFPAWTVTPDATTLYSIDAQTVYIPVSSSIESATHYANIDQVLHKYLFSRGSFTLPMTPKNLAKFAFDFMSLYSAPVELALQPGQVLDGFKAPLPVKNTWSSGFQLHGFTAIMYDLSISPSQKVVHSDDTIGIEDTNITDRAPTGSTTIRAPLQSEFDAYTRAHDVTLGELLFTHGINAGYRMRLAAPAVQVKSPKPGEKEGIATLGLDLRFNRVNGDDEFFLIFD